MAYYVNDGEVSSGIILEDNHMHVSSGGLADHTTASLWGQLHVFSGGTANNTTVNKDGYLTVYNGGTANSTTVNFLGDLTVYNGGTANSTLIPAGSLFVSEGGTANSTTVDYCGWMYVKKGGTANNTTVNSKGSMFVSSGGKHAGALQVAEGGIVSAYEGAVIDFTVAGRTGADDYLINNVSLITGTPTYTITVAGDEAAGTYKLAQGAGSFTGTLSIGTATENYGTVTVNGESLTHDETEYSLIQSDGNLTLQIAASAPAAVFIYSSGALVSSGIMISGAALAGGGNDSMFVSSGGTADSTTVNSGGYLHVSSGGTAADTTVNSSGYLHVSSGGSANNTTVNNGGRLRVSDGAVANNITVSYGHLVAGDGGTVNSAAVNYGNLVVWNGATVNSTVLNNGSADISSGGTANNTTVNNGSMTVSSGGSANDTTVNNGSMIVSSGGGADGIFINTWGKGYVRNSGSAAHTTVNSGGTLYIHGGGTATEIMENGGYVQADSGAEVTFAPNTFSGLVLNAYQNATVHSGTTALNTIVNSDGRLYISSGGTADQTTVNGSGLSYSGVVIIRGEGLADHTTLNSNGHLHVSSGGLADHTTADLWGQLHVSSGGTAANTTVNSVGFLYVSGGGKHTGSLQIAQDANVSAYEGGIIDFTVAGRTSEDGYLINNLSWIKGPPTYTITVAGDEAAGTYKLAQGAGSFTGTLSIGTATENYGSITVNGEALTHDETEYSLIRSGGNLTLQIAASAPAAVFIYSSGALVSSGAMISGAALAGGGNDSMFVSSGGIANTTILNSWGAMYISAGGTANSTTVNSVGRLFVYSGGTANSTTVNSGGSLYVSSGGTANSTTVNSVGRLFVYSGGTANSTTVNSVGWLYVSGGGTAADATVFGGNLSVSSGGTANSTMVNFSGYLYVYSGGTANSTTVNSGGWLYVLSGGTATGATVNSGGNLYVSSGGTATDVVWTPCVGRVWARPDAVVTYVSSYTGVYFGSANELLSHTAEMDGKIVSGSMYVMNAGTADNTQVNTGGRLWVYSGGTANSTTVNSKGYLFVYSGGTANSTTVNSGGYLYVSSGGTADDVILNVGGGLNVSSGGSAALAFNPWSGTVTAEEGAVITELDRDAAIYIGGSEVGLAGKYDSVSDQIIGSGLSALVYDSGVMTGTTINSGGCLRVLSGGTAESTTVNSNGCLHVSGGGTAESTTVNSNGCLHVSGGGTAADATVFGGSAVVSSGGLLSSAAVVSSGRLEVLNGGTAADVDIDRDGKVFVASSGTMSAVRVNFLGEAYVSGGGTAGDVNVASGGYLVVLSSGTVSNATVNPGGIITVMGLGTLAVAYNPWGGTVVSSAGADITQLDRDAAIYIGGSEVGLTGKYDSVSDQIIGSGLSALVFDSGVMTNTTVSSGGNLTISSGGNAVDTTITAGGSMTVSNGGLAENTTVSTSGTLTISSGGRASDTTVQSGAVLTMDSGIHTGELIIESGGSAVLNNTVLDFDLRGRTPADDYLVNDLSAVSGVSGYTITLDADQADGLYKLAQGAASFAGSVTVRSATSEYGVIVCNGEALQTDTFRLLLETTGEGNLVFSIDSDLIPPAAPTVSADITSLTDQNVTLTATYSEDTAVGQYSIDSLTWEAYTGPVAVNTNGTYYFRGLDAAGNVSDVTDYTVSNIVSTTFTVVDTVLDAKAFISLPVSPEASAAYSLKGDFDPLTNGTVTIVQNNGKTVGKGTIKNGNFVFNKGKEILLDRSKTYFVTVKNTGKTGSSAYNITAEATKLFLKGDNSDDAISAPLTPVQLDTPGQPVVTDGWVGFSDEVDYHEITLDSPAKLSLDYTATDAVKFTLINAATGKSVLSSSVTAKKPLLTTKPKLLDAGTYYLQVQSTNKKGGDADYTVGVNSSTVFYTKGDTTDDVFTSSKDLGTVSATGNLDSGWVGYGDEIDFKTITLDTAAKMNFTVNSGDAVKFNVYQLDPKGKLKSLGSVSVKAGKEGFTKDIFVDAGTYYLQVQSTNAKKGGDAEYSIALNGNTVFFPQGDKTNDTWQTAQEQAAKLPGEDITGWVGYGDAADFIKFELEGSGKIELTLDDDTANALASKQIKLTCLDSKGKSVAIAVDKNDPCTLSSKKEVGTGTYYLGVSCANVKKYDTTFSITTGLLAG